MPICAGPPFTNEFDLENAIGLGDVLYAGADWRHATRHLPGIEGLSILPAGKVSMPAADLFGSAFRNLLQVLNTEFDLIIVDAPPMLPPSRSRFKSRPWLTPSYWLCAPVRRLPPPCEASSRPCNGREPTILGVVLESSPEATAKFGCTMGGAYSFPSREEAFPARRSRRRSRRVT